MCRFRVGRYNIKATLVAVQLEKKDSAATLPKRKRGQAEPGKTGERNGKEKKRSFLSRLPLLVLQGVNFPEQVTLFSPPCACIYECRSLSV